MIRNIIKQSNKNKKVDSENNLSDSKKERRPSKLLTFNKKLCSENIIYESIMDEGIELSRSELDED